jgi:hypothetical protein
MNMNAVEMKCRKFVLLLLISRRAEQRRRSALVGNPLT